MEDRKTGDPSGKDRILKAVPFTIGKIVSVSFVVSRQIFISSVCPCKKTPTFVSFCGH